MHLFISDAWSDWLLWWQQGEVLRRIGIARFCMNMLERRIWKSSIRLVTKLRLYQTYIVPVWAWNMGYHKIPALSPWCIWHVGTTCQMYIKYIKYLVYGILRITYTCHVSNAEVRGTTGCSPLSHLVTNRRLRLFGHVARSSSREDHYRALAAAIRQVTPNWKRPIFIITPKQQTVDKIIQ